MKRAHDDLPSRGHGEPSCTASADEVFTEFSRCQLGEDTTRSLSFQNVLTIKQADKEYKFKVVDCVMRWSGSKHTAFVLNLLNRQPNPTKHHTDSTTLLVRGGRRFLLSKQEESGVWLSKSELDHATAIGGPKHTVVAGKFPDGQVMLFDASHIQFKNVYPDELVVCVNCLDDW